MWTIQASELNLKRTAERDLGRTTQNSHLSLLLRTDYYQVHSTLHCYWSRPNACLVLTDIVFPAPVTGADAVELKVCERPFFLDFLSLYMTSLLPQAICPMNVFDIEDMGKHKIPTAVVARPRDCTMCRECIRREGWNNKVHLRRVADHFIFTVESSGCMPPADIVKEVCSFWDFVATSSILQLP
jgi:hypothetical protein